MQIIYGNSDCNSDSMISTEAGILFSDAFLITAASGGGDAPNNLVILPAALDIIVFLAACWSIKIRTLLLGSPTIDAPLCLK